MTCVVTTNVVVGIVVTVYRAKHTHKLFFCYRYFISRLYAINLQHRKEISDQVRSKDFLNNESIFLGPASLLGQLRNLGNPLLNNFAKTWPQKVFALAILTVSGLFQVSQNIVTTKELHYPP